MPASSAVTMTTSRLLRVRIRPEVLKSAAAQSIPSVYASEPEGVKAATTYASRRTTAGRTEGYWPSANSKGTSPFASGMRVRLPSTAANSPTSITNAGWCDDYGGVYASSYGHDTAYTTPYTYVPSAAAAAATAAVTPVVGPSSACASAATGSAASAILAAAKGVRRTTTSHPAAKVPVSTSAAASPNPKGRSRTNRTAFMEARKILLKKDHLTGKDG